MKWNESDLELDPDPVVGGTDPHQNVTIPNTGPKSHT